MKTHLSAIEGVVILLCFAVGSFQTGRAEDFKYTIMATGTETVVTYPPQSFTYTVTGTGTETWSETIRTNRDLSFKVVNNEFGTIGKSFPIVALISGKGRVDYDLRGKEGSLVRTGVSSSMSFFNRMINSSVQIVLWD